MVYKKPQRGIGQLKLKVKIGPESRGQKLHLTGFEPVTEIRSDMTERNHGEDNKKAI